MIEHTQRLKHEWRNDADQLRSRIADLEQRVLTGSQVEHADRLAETRRQLAAARRTLAETGGQVFDLTRSAQVLERQIEDLGNRQHLIDGFIDDHGPSLDLLLGPQGRYVSRLARAEDLNELSVGLRAMTDATEADVISAVSQAYRLVFELEIRGLGRIAGSVPNVLGKLAAITLLRPGSGEVLEIGTLFGIGAAALARQLSRQGLDYHVTIIDPVAGHQIQPGGESSLDVSFTPATRIVVNENLSLAGVPADRYRLIEGLSTSPDVRTQASDRTYGLIVIDGDHSVEVAFSDLLWAESVAAPGALVMLDDYRDQTRPGVENALERYLARPDSSLVMLGTASTTAFLRS